MTEFQILLVLWDETKPEEQRKGQWAFNVVHEYHPEIANSIRGTIADPFYDDAALGRFWATVERRLLSD